MVRLVSFLKFFVPITLVLLLFFQPGSCRELIMRSSKGVNHFATTDSHQVQESRVMMQLDYEDAGPNTNKRSGLTQPLPSPDSPAPVEG